MVFPEPVISVAIEPKTKSDQEKMSVALGRLAEEDPTFQVETNEETGQTEISGMGELHLEILVDRMMREFKVEANIGRPQVSYRETITAHRRRRSRAATCARPAARASTASSTSTSSRRPARASTSSTRSRAARSPRSSSPRSRRAPRRRWATACSPATRVVDVRVTLTDGKYHDTDSSEIAFKIAGSLGMQEALRRAKPTLLEPIFKVEVVTPEDYLGDVIGDLSRRRGRIEGQEPRGNALAVTGMVPLSEMFGYATEMRSMTQGRATYTMQFEKYDEVPANVATKVIEERTGRADAA